MTREGNFAFEFWFVLRSLMEGSVVEILVMLVLRVLLVRLSMM